MKRSWWLILGVTLLSCGLWVPNVAGLDLKVQIGSEQPVVNGGGPPPSTPLPASQGRSQLYRYYPSAQVYFEPARNMWFYMSGGTWQVGASLPGGLSVQVGDYVNLELNTERPYIYHAEHRQKYPPGQMKEKPGKGGKAKGLHK